MNVHSPMSSGVPPASSQDPVIEGGGRVLVIDDSVTILKVVSTILERNGYAVTVARDGMEGFEKLAAEAPFDLVLLDFVMPRMNGYQFCRKLRADAKHKHTPVVLMSARTGTIGDRFVEQTGAIDALGKPFDARALVAVVGAVLEKQAAQLKVRSLPSPETMMDEDELSMGPESAPPSRHFRSLGQVGHAVATAVAPHIRRLRPEDLSAPNLLEEAIIRGINEDVIYALVQALDDLELKNKKSEMLRGEVSQIPLAEVLQLLQLRRQTGVMRVRHGREEVTLYINEGTLDLAQSVGTDDEFRLGRYFVEANLLSRDEVDEILANLSENELFGEHLVESERISHDDLIMALAKQSSELVYEVLRWPDGRFILSEEHFSEEAQKAQLGLGLSGLVLEGFRRVDEWRLMADTIDFEAVLVLDQMALGSIDEAKFSSAENAVLMAIDGQRTARDVMEFSEVASFDAIKAIYRFLQSRIARENKRSRTGSVASMEAVLPSDVSLSDGEAEPVPNTQESAPDQSAQG